ncbi:MAG TPA: ABC transporter ATP-binding protein, partial [Thermodesulfobacteriota bacterium]|nr:ABC transporter ATP-binding protein [Thermodesulfobacteriota bacterium]
KVENLCVAYGDVQVLHEVNIRLLPGEIVAVLGSNGAGKTTLLQAISGLLSICQGRIIFESRDLATISAHQLPGLGLAHVPQGRGIFATLTVMDNLTIGAWNPRGKKEREKNIQMVFDLFPRLRERSKQTAGTLSGGEQQMLAIGRALMQNPLLLMLDEPSLGLAPILVEAVFATVEKIIAQGLSILLVEQNIFYAIDLASRCYLLENGRISLEGLRSEFTENPKIKEAYLGM